MGRQKFYCFLVFASLQILRTSQAMSNDQIENKRILDKLFDGSYDVRIRPSGVNNSGSPVNVHVNIMLLDVTSISDYDMDYNIILYIRQEWVDSRLRYDDNGNIPYVPISDTSKIWTPDLFFLNEKDGLLHKVLTQNSFLRIYPTGKILYSARLSLTLWCHMQLENFPFDSQRCQLRMESYGYSTKDLQFVWKNEAPVQISKKVMIVGFALTKFLCTNCTAVTSTGEYTCLKTEFLFTRELKYYVLHTFIPSGVLVMMSWLTFWMDRHALVARILLLLSSLFAMSSLTTDIESSMPHVGYVKALDVWTGVCFLFLVAALLELVVANAITRPEMVLRRDEGSATVVDMKPLVRQSSNSPQPEHKSSTLNSAYQKLLPRLPSDALQIDTMARVIFPVLFFVFTMFYFSVYYVFESDY